MVDAIHPEVVDIIQLGMEEQVVFIQQKLGMGRYGNGDPSHPTSLEIIVEIITINGNINLRVK